MRAHLLRPIGAALVLALFTQPAAAQDRRTSATGSGSLTLRGLATEQIVKVDLRLGAQGEFELDVYGSRPLAKWSFVGQYSGAIWSARVDLRVRDALGDDGTGDGFISFDQYNAPREISIRGTTSARSFELRYRGDGSGGERTPVVISEPLTKPPYAGDDRGRADRGLIGNFDRTRAGRGTIKRRALVDELDRMRVRLREDGTADLRADGNGRTWNIRARWREASRNRIEFDVLEFEGLRTDGRGEMQLEGRGFDRVNVQLRTRNGTTQLRFDAVDRFDRDDDDDRLGDGVPLSYDRTHDARGSFDSPRWGRVEVRRIEIDLERSGDARLRLRVIAAGRDESIEIRGTWKAARNGAAEMRWDRIDGVTVAGSGQVTFFNGRDAERVRGLARTGNGRLGLDVTIVR